MSIPNRKIYWNLPSEVNQWALYFFFLVSFIILLNGIYWRYRTWSLGKPDSSRFSNWPRRVLVLVKEILLQHRVRRERSPKVFHTLIFFGFLVLLFTTTMVFIHQDLHIHIYQGTFYLAVTVLSDIFGFLLLVGVALSLYRRYVEKPDSLHSTEGDLLMLGLLAVMVIQGFLLEALRIAVTSDPWAHYSPVGYLVSLFFWGLSPRAMTTIHFALWWIHSLTVFIFIALLPYTKFLHIVTSSANLFFQNLDTRKTALRFPGDVEQMLSAAEDAGDFSMGVKSIADLSWKQRLDLDSCTSCGRCQDVCPAYNSGKILSPKWLILDTRKHVLSLVSQGKSTVTDGAGENGWCRALDRALLKQVFFRDESGPGVYRAKNELVQNAVIKLGHSATDSLAGAVIDENVFWSCTTCRACVEACPVGIDHVNYIVDVRRSMALMDGNLPQEAQAALRAMENRGNPFGDPNDRLKWADGLSVPVLQPGMDVEVLYWVGCVSAYDKRKQNIARSMVKILNASGYRWAVLGTQEHCTGDPARRLGEENLFQSLAKKNIELLRQVKFGTVVANCPHCFHTFKNEYPNIGDFTNGRPVRVVHHSHFIRELIESGKIIAKTLNAADVTYHDPCYLGRYNDTYDEPREVLVQLGGKALREMANDREKSLCCGAGGGHYFFDMKVGERVNVQRVNQAAETGANLIATACPFCMQMLEDGIKLTDREETLRVKDIAELVAEGL